MCAASRSAVQCSAVLSVAGCVLHRITKGALPKIMLQMQSLEEMRLHSLNSALQAFVSLQDGMAEQFEGTTHTAYACSCVRDVC
jgi:hypothetical protein